MVSVSNFVSFRDFCVYESVYQVKLLVIFLWLFLSVHLSIFHHLSLFLFHLIPFYYCYYYYYFKDACLFSNKRVRKGVEFVWWRGLGGLGGVGRRENVVRIYWLKTNQVLIKINRNKKEQSA